MRTNRSGFVLATAMLGTALPCWADPGPGDLILEGPYVHGNLAVFVVRGRATDDREYITLDEGLRSLTVEVTERGGRGEGDRATVNTLEIENRSTKWLFLQAGDVVKGGKQDRTIGVDLTLAPGSGPQSIPAFCVEHGRWQRGAKGSRFADNTAIVSGNSLKLAIQGKKDQGEVWKEVARLEAKGAEASLASVPAAPPADAASSAVPPAVQARPAGRASGGSVRLSTTGTYNAVVENGALAKERQAYVDALLPKLQAPKDALGIVAALNGEVTAADVYGSPALFRKLSRKLIESYALEAALSGEAGKTVTAPTLEGARAFLGDAERAEKAPEETLSPVMIRRTRESAKTVLYEYGAPAEAPAHRMYLKK